MCSNIMTTSTPGTWTLLQQWWGSILLTFPWLGFYFLKLSWPLCTFCVNAYVVVHAVPAWPSAPHFDDFPFDRASETSKIWKAKPAPVTTVGTALLLLACLTLASPDKDFFL